METDPLLPGSLPEPVNYLNLPPSRSSSGRWPSALFIIGVEITERFAYYGVSSNLITYLTGPLGQSTAGAAAAINAWSGFSSLLPLLGAFVADSWLGRYRTIVIASVVYLVALMMLTLSSTLPYLRPPNCTEIESSNCSVSLFQLLFFFFSLYLVAIAQSGHKPCTQAFGADQFDQNDPDEKASRSSFFNWWYFGMCAGNVFTVSILNYVQDNIGWGLGFGIPCVAMFCALLIFLMGTKTYRFYPVQKESPFARVGKSIWKLIKGSNKKKNIKESDDSLDEQEITNSSNTNEAKQILKLFPIWSTLLIYAVVFAQWSTFFIKQAATLDRRIGPTFKVPSASLSSFINISVICFIPIYTKILIPTFRKITKRPSGITMLQRIGIGMAISLLSMVVAALVEMKRLSVVKEFDLVDRTDVPVPMSLWWIIPQFFLVGMADVFTMVGLQEFFYDQVPDQLRSLGLALYLSIFGIGSFISSFLVELIDKYSTRNGYSWFADNLNRGHLDYFYWLLAVLSGLALLVYWWFSSRYVYKKKESDVMIG